MPAVQYGLSSYERAEGDLPGLPVINMYAEEAPTEGDGVMLQSRRGLKDRGVTMGTGPVAGLFQRDLVLESSLFGVSDGNLYRDDNLVGPIDGTGPVSMAGYENLLFVNAGASIWGYDGTTLAQIVFPDEANVERILIGDSRLIAIRRDTGQFYWTDPLGSTIDALDFATAENQPDRLLDLLFIDDTLLLFGAETVEFWPSTGDSALPFQPQQGRVIEKGIRAPGCAASIGSTYAWVTNEHQICLQDENTIISNPGLQTRIENSENVGLFAFLLDGIEFLALRLDGETQVWSFHTKMWSEFTSYGQENWIPQCAAGSVFGSSVDGKTLAWGSDYTDIGTELERRFRGGFPLNAGGVTIANVGLRVNVGHTTFLTGDYADPAVEMRLSRDAAQTWGSWRRESLGEQGNYRAKVQWRGCGLASQPGFIAEFRCTDPVPFRVSGVFINEQYGGR